MFLPLLLAAAGQNAISGDRPGFLASSSLVPAGRVQIETGLSFDRPRGASDTSSTPSAWRYGLSDDLELRAGTSGWNRVDAHGAPDEQGFGPLTLGVKGTLERTWADLDLGWVDSAAWVAELRLPGGTLAGAPSSVSPALSAVASWTPDQGLWQLRGLLGLAYEPEDGSLTVSLAAGASRPISDTTSLYLQAGWFPRSLVEPDPLFVGAGLIALASTDVQLDLGLDLGLGETSGDWRAGLGICWRW
jgi:hypothetical protein